MSSHSKRNHERTPLNSEGDFYVEEGTCLWCMAPESEAPELMGFAKPDGCFFRRQSGTADEIDHAINAVRVSCVEALRYAGRDATILERLRVRGCGHLCDALSSSGDIEQIVGPERGKPLS
jgi:hypothetical protein